MGIKQAFLLFIICTTATFAQGTSKFRVVIDPGHGGKDFGAIYNGFVEKNIALNVALRVGKILEEDPNLDVVFTRKTDAFVEITDRADIANKADADVFVSLHCNTESKKTAFGAETYFAGATKNAASIEVAKKENAVLMLEKDFKTKYEGFDLDNPEIIAGTPALTEAVQNKSIELAGKLQEGFMDIKRKSRGVKQGPFWLLNKVAMPGVLVELGFLSSQDEGVYINSDSGQDELAKSIAKSILAYKKEAGITVKDNAAPAVAAAPAANKPAPVQPAAKPAAPAPKPDEDEKAAISGNVTFKVQIAASGKDIELSPANFKGLNNISKEGAVPVIKYFYGATPDYDKARQFLAEAKEKGYTGAFVVAYKGGKKITIQEALNK